MLIDPLAADQFQHLLPVQRRHGSEVEAVQVLVHRKVGLSAAAGKRIGWRNKLWMTKAGHARGGGPMDMGALWRILTNVI